MKWMKQLVLVVSIILVPAIGFIDTAGAESDVYRNYGQIHLGLNAFTGDMDNAGFDSDVELGAAYNRYLSPHLVLEAAVDFFGSDKDSYGSTPTTGFYKIEDTIAVLGFLATVKGEFPAGPLRIFGGGGVGFYALALHSELTTAYFGELDKNENDNVFGVHVVAGVNYNITARFFAGLQGLYRWTDDIDINKTLTTVPVRLKGDLNGYTVALTAGFRF